MKRLLWIVAILCGSLGCEEPRLRLQARDAWTGKILLQERPYLTEACEILGHRCELTTDRRGAVRVSTLLIQDGGIGGFVINGHGCKRWVVADWDPLLVAHELAHALGHPEPEDHDPATCRILNPRDPGTELTQGQQATVDQHVRRMWRCR